uniref:Uncharacterized protein n=2 Tax=Pan TaxID=9596 RepID=A0A2I3T1X0_PANTR
MAILAVAARLLGSNSASCLVLAAWHASASSKNLKDILADLIVKEQARIKTFRQQHGKKVVGQITGICFRGFSIPEYQKLLPKTKGGENPYPGAYFGWQAALPSHVVTMLDNFPTNPHPCLSPLQPWQP